MNAGLVAMVCHEANRAYCVAIGDNSQPSWENAERWQKDSAIEGIRVLIEAPSTTPEQLHKKWCEAKTRDGWKHGPVKDPLLKTHPCLVDYEELPEEQRLKDYLFQAVARVLIPLPGGFVHV